MQVIIDRDKIKTNTVICAFIDGIESTEEGNYRINEKPKEEGDTFIYKRISKNY